MSWVRSAPARYAASRDEYVSARVEVSEDAVLRDGFVFSDRWQRRLLDDRFRSQGALRSGAELPG
jgi:hypothetical protein